MQEEQIIRAVINGQSEMFRLLYRSYSKNCWNVALGIVKSEYLAEDAVQNAFIIAYEKLGTFKGESSFKTWLIRIVINESLKLLKRNQRYLFVEDTHEALEEQTKVLESSDEILKLEQNALRQVLFSSMAKLPDVMRLVLNLFYLEEMSINEIVEATDLSKANVKTSLFRARKELKVILNNKFKFV